MVWPLIAAGGAAVLGAGLDYLSNRSKKKAVEKSAAEQQRIIEEQIRSRERAGRQAYDTLGSASVSAEKYLRRGSRDATRMFRRGSERQLSELGSGYDRSLGDYDAGMSGAQGALQSGADSALSEIDRGYAGSKLADLWSPTFQEDPGYSFRLTQGNTALARMGAAAGGRLSGAALKKASEYNQGFASNEYGNWFGRMSGIGSQLDAASQAQGMARAGIQSGLGSGLAGLYERGGQYRSGLASNLSANRSNIIGNETEQVAGLEQGLGSSLANLYTGTAANQANVLTGTAGATNNLSMESLPTYAAGDQYAGAGWHAASGAVSQLGNIASFGYGSGMLGGGGAAARGADAYGYGDVGRNPSSLSQFYGTSYAPAGYYQ